MKIRNGFVSNSSSSSFIIGIGKVVDKLKLLHYLKDNEVNIGYDGVNFSVSEQSGYYINKDENKFYIRSFNDTEVSLKRGDLEQFDDIIYCYFCGDEGDNAFYDNDAYDINYNIGYDFFSDDEKKLFDVFNIENGIEFGSISFGAGRNG